MQAEVERLVFIPVAVAYDLVLEDKVLSRQGVKRRQRPFTSELAEMMRDAFGYRSRAFITFGEPIATDGHDSQSRRDILDLAHTVRDAIGRIYKVMPTALVAAAMRPASTRADVEARVDRMIDSLREAGANLAVHDGREALDHAGPAFEARGVLVFQGDRVRVRSRTLLRYYARTIEHLLNPPKPRTH